MRHRPENDTEYTGLPEHLRRGMRAYIEEHQPMGHFGTAVLSNDLMNAVLRADGITGPALEDIARWVYNEAPGNCWGSPEAVQRWLAERELESGKREG